MADSDNESGGHSGGGGKGGGGGPSREQDRFLPIANVSRIMKKGLPANAKISKDAKETMQECVSEFISFVTGEASDKCQREKRKTINGDDLLWAMTTLGFEKYVDPLKLYLLRFREIEGEKTGTVPSAPKDSTAAAAGSSGMYATGGMMMIGAAQQMFEAAAPAAQFQQPHPLTNMNMSLNMSMNMGGIKNSNLGSGDHGGGGRHGRI